MTNTILSELKANNVKIKDLSQKLGVNRSAIYQSINGGGSRNIRVQIALKIGTKPSELWTDNDPRSLEVDDVMFWHWSQQK